VGLFDFITAKTTQIKIKRGNMKNALMDKEKVDIISDRLAPNAR
jgi:hypothetical protein